MASLHHHNRLKNFVAKLGMEMRYEDNLAGIGIYRDGVCLCRDRSPTKVLTWVMTYGMNLPLPPGQDWREVVKESRGPLLDP